jgi:cell division protein FtsN
MAAKTTKNRRGRGAEYVSPSCPPGWAWLLAGIVIGMFISFLIYLREIAPHTVPTSTVASENVGESNPNIPQNFEFYDALPNSEVKVPETAENSSQGEALPQTDLPITVPGRYLLQVGSFRNEQEAEGLKNYIISLGVQAKIEKTTLTEAGRWYRVQVGPFTDLDQLNKTRTLLAENNIPVILRKF